MDCGSWDFEYGFALGYAIEVFRRPSGEHWNPV